MVQVVALPAVILVYTLNPAYVPAVFAAIRALPAFMRGCTARAVRRARGRDLTGIVAADRASWLRRVPLFWSACLWAGALLLRGEVGRRTLPTIA